MHLFHIHNICLTSTHNTCPTLTHTCKYTHIYIPIHAHTTQCTYALTYGCHTQMYTYACIYIKHPWWASALAHLAASLSCFISQTQKRESLFLVKALVTYRCLFHYSCFSSWSVTFPINSPQGRRPSSTKVGVVGRKAESLETCPPSACNWPQSRLQHQHPALLWG